MPRKIAAGNWKMHGTASWLDQITTISGTAATLTDVTTIICVPTTLIHRACNQNPSLATGAQDCHHEQSGAHTGDVSAEMLADAGAAYVITGHSERRSAHLETDPMVATKTKAAWRAGLTAIVCIGETREQYQSGVTLDVLRSQLNGSLPEHADAASTIIAYEPVWAIGTGLTPSPTQIARAHETIRTCLAEYADPDISILYGGSVSADNAETIFAIPNVDGALVGGASLTAESFVPIMKALDNT